MTEILKRISDWKNAAENEPLDDKYFYSPPWLDEIVSGDRAIILGRKGMGKTAIAQHLAASDTQKAYSVTLSLEALDLPTTGDSAKILGDRALLIKAWKYIILRAVCEVFLDNATGSVLQLDELAETLGPSFTKQRNGSIVQRLRKVRLDVGFFGVEVGLRDQQEAHEATIDAKLSAMQDFLEANIYTTAYRVVFDALDKSWIEACEDKQQSAYLRTVAALISAAIDVNNYFKQLSLPRKILPIVFLRSDIFSQIANAQRAAWEDDHAVRLTWSNQDLREFVKHRILQTARIVDSKATAKDALAQTFSAQAGELIDLHGAERRINFVDFIIEYSLGRPRDVVMYLKAAARSVVAGANYSGSQKINKKVIADCQKDYGRFLRREIHDELGAEYPGIARLLNGLQAGGRSVLSFDEFCNIARERLGTSLTDGDLTLLAERLFELSFFGHQMATGERFFPVRDEVDFDAALPLAIHPCYAVALNLPITKLVPAKRSRRRASA